MKKQVLIIVSIAIIVGSFVACSKSNSNTSKAITQNETSTKITSTTSDLEQIQESKAVSNSTTKRNSDSSKVPDNDINYDGTTTTKKSGTPTTHSSKKHTTTEKTTTSNGTTKKEPATDKDGWITKWY